MLLQQLVMNIELCYIFMECHWPKSSLVTIFDVDHCFFLCAKFWETVWPLKYTVVRYEYLYFCILHVQYCFLNL